VYAKVHHEVFHGILVTSEDLTPTNKNTVFGSNFRLTSQVISTTTSGSWKKCAGIHPFKKKEHMLRSKLAWN